MSKEVQTAYGMCTASAGLEAYPTGHGCELCSSDQTADVVTVDLDDSYFDGQTLPDALASWEHVHAATGICVKAPGGHFCHATTATIPPVSPRPRGEVSRDQIRRFVRAENALDDAKHEFRQVVLAIMAEGGSFSEVSKATGISTNTLQRWKREASPE